MFVSTIVRNFTHQNISIEWNENFFFIQENRPTMQNENTLPRTTFIWTGLCHWPITRILVRLRWTLSYPLLINEIRYVIFREPESFQLIIFISSFQWQFVSESTWNFTLCVSIQTQVLYIRKMFVLSFFFLFFFLKIIVYSNNWILYLYSLSNSAQLISLM